MILGGLIVLVLVTVLIGPYFINWNGFRTTFENRAADVLGQPVRILGDVDLSMLPSPTVTMNDVEVGDTEGQPMATIDHLSLRLEMLPLITGQFNVTELVLDHPVVNATVDDTGTLDWMLRPQGAGTLDPERVAIDRLAVNDGTLAFFDVRTGGTFTFGQINTNQIKATTLNGPWQIDGSLVCQAEVLCGDGLPVTFSLSSGRLNPDGSMRINAEITPASAALAGTLRTEGTVTEEDGLLAYDGTFTFGKLNVVTGPPANAAPETLDTAWSISGGFRLAADQLTLREFTWETSDGLYSVSGDGTLTLGAGASFDTTLTSRQIDLDRTLGEGEAATIAAAGTEVWQRLTELMPPRLPGHVSLTIPSVIAAGSVLQDVRLDVNAERDYWQIGSLQLQLPGQTQAALSGRLDPGAAPIFAGQLDVSTEQPSVLATWWRGQDASDLGLQPFSLTAAVAVNPTGLTLSEAELHIDESSLNGTLAWRYSGEDGATTRSLTADLTTQSFDLDQLRALADLLSGGNTGDSVGTAQSYALRLDADEIRAGDVAIGDVALNLVLTPDTLTVNDLTIGNLDGGAVTATGAIDDLAADRPRGSLTATLQAERLDGVVALAQHLAPDAEITAWLAKTAPFLAPLDVTAEIAAQSTNGGYSINIAGTAADSTLRVEVNTDGGLDDWANNTVDMTVELDAADSAQLARQVGFVDATAEDTGPGTVDIAANGVPADGMVAHLQATLASVAIASDGTLTFDGVNDPKYVGPISASGDLSPLTRLLGVVLPNGDASMPSVLEAQLNIDGGVVGIDLQPSSIDQRSVAGTLQLAQTDGTWSVTGTLDLEELDLGWLATWPLGYDPLPLADASEPWSTAPFGGALMNSLALDVDVNADRFVLGENLTIANADVGFTLGDNQARIDLRNGSLSTGLVRSTLSLGFQDGQVVLDGQLFLADVPMEALVWRSDGQPVADGVVGLSAEFGAIGRSAAGLVSTLAGSGSLDISQGVFHFMGADAFDLVIRLADEGETPTEDQLRDVFTGFLDAGTLDFGDATVPFDIAAGIVTPGTIAQEAGPVQVVVRAPIDLNQLTIDSSWELTMIEGRGIDEGPQPRAFVTFTGPLASPVRQVNITPLAGYLSLRRLRQTEQLQADVLERERFIRLIERIEADRAAAPAAVPAEASPAATPESAPASAPAPASPPADSAPALLIPPGP